jgi:peptide/nickel transport system permease protein
VRRTGLVLLALVAAVAAAAPWLAPNPPEQRFDSHLYAPPTRVHLFRGGLRAPYVYQSRLVSRLERRFEDDETRPVPLRWVTGGRLVSVDEGSGPLLLLGADAFGRDILARLLHGARATLGLAAIATVAAILIGALVGGISGYAGGAIDELLSRTSDFVLVLPAIYVALALRAVMPLVLPARTVFILLAAIFALLGWPIVARGVRAIVASERTREYAVASHALGAGPVRMLAFILAEATLSYVGLGFPDTVPTWGTMLQDAANVALLVEAPWMLAPAAAIFVVVLAVNLAVQGGGRAPVQLEGIGPR